MDRGLTDLLGRKQRESYAFMAIGRDDAPMVPDEAREGFPHRVYGVSLEDMAGNKGLAGATLIGWRYLLGKSGNILAPVSMASEVTTNAKGGGHQFAGTNEGPFVAQTLEMMQIASRMKTVRDGNFVPCLLRIPSLFVAALWLKSDGGPDGDLILPMAPCHDALKPGLAYSRKKLEGALKKAAQAGLEFDSRPHPTQ